MAIGVEVKEPRDKLPREKSLSLEREREGGRDCRIYGVGDTQKKKKERKKGIGVEREKTVESDRA